MFKVFKQFSFETPKGISSLSENAGFLIFSGSSSSRQP